MKTITKKQMKKVSVAECLKLIYENQVNANAIRDIPKEELQNFILEVFNKGILDNYLRLKDNVSAKPNSNPEKIKMKFWMNNLTANEYEASISQIASEFIRSKDYQLYKKGMKFQRCMLVFMTDAYGSFEQITDEHMSAIFKEVKRLKQS